jgi:SAM-dependent methyltransferase
MTARELTGVAATDRPPRGSFGKGLTGPYAHALRKGGGTLSLRPAGGSHGTDADAVDFDAHSWCAEATPEERALLGVLAGPVLDIGCGPGRLLAAAQTLDLTALGIDTSAEAVRQARARGGQALHQSVFAAVPSPGHWQSLLLFDGNIGIGGSVTLLLRRCRDLVAPSGTLMVEVEDREIDVAYRAVLEDREGNVSEPFLWARAGRAALMERAARTGWAMRSTQRVQGRLFCRLEPRPWPVRSNR